MFVNFVQPENAPAKVVTDVALISHSFKAELLKALPLIVVMVFPPLKFFKEV